MEDEEGEEDFKPAKKKAKVEKKHDHKKGGANSSSPTKKVGFIRYLLNLDELPVR